MLTDFLLMRGRGSQASRGACGNVTLGIFFWKFSFPGFRFFESASNVQKLEKENINFVQTIFQIST